MINFEILKGGGKGRGTRAHVFLNCVINLNKKTKKNKKNKKKQTGLTMGGEGTAYILS